ncbi:hypothetical protein BH24BAC1_BH24BAC1_00730 [soil metagenome]
MLFFLIFLVSLLLQFFLPWWIVAPVAFGLALWRGRSGWQAFGAGFGAVALGWLGASLVIHLRTEGILTAKVADLLTLPSPLLLLALTALLGGLVGGLAALSGYFLRRAYQSSSRSRGFRQV